MSDASDLAHDPFLHGVPVVAGFKTLGSCALYEKLGQGGMGAVYRARHVNLDIDVAVKCLLPSQRERASDTARREAVQRFVREARVAAQLGHENLVRVYDVAEAHDLHYLVMEFVDGETLRGRVKRKGALDPDEAVTIVLAAARGLAAAHRRGIIHRDIKPDNIMVSRQGEVKLADLGLARAAEAVDSLATSRGAIMGTPSYMPPEQFVDASQVGTAADVWSMGATLYFLVTGKDGIRAGSPVEAMHQVCTVGFPTLDAAATGALGDLVPIIARCMASEPGQRFADAGGLAEALAASRVASSAETMLVDDEARPLGPASLVSPPPAPTLDVIREQMSGATLAVGAAAAASPADVDADEAPTALSDAPATMHEKAAGPSTFGRAALVLGLVVVAAITGALINGWMTGGAADQGDSSGRADQESTAVADTAKEETAELPEPTGTPSERLERARTLVKSPKTLDEGIARLRRLRGDAPALAGTTEVLAGALLAQARNRRAENLWVEALQSCRASLALAPSAGAREVEGEIVERIQGILRSSFTLRKPSKSKPALALEMKLEGWVSGDFVERVTLGDRSLELFGGYYTIDWTAPASGEIDVPFIVHGPEGVTVPARATILVDVTPPVITIDSAEVKSGQLEITGHVRDDTQVKQLRVNDAEGKYIRIDQKTGAFSVSLERAPEDAGELRLWARDAGQREATVLVP